MRAANMLDVLSGLTLVDMSTCMPVSTSGLVHVLGLLNSAGKYDYLCLEAQHRGLYSNPAFCHHGDQHLGSGPDGTRLFNKFDGEGIRGMGVVLCTWNSGIAMKMLLLSHHSSVQTLRAIIASAPAASSAAVPAILSKHSHTPIPQHALSCTYLHDALLMVGVRIVSLSHCEMHAVTGFLKALQCLVDKFRMACQDTPGHTLALSSAVSYCGGRGRPAAFDIGLMDQIVPFVDCGWVASQNAHLHKPQLRAKQPHTEFEILLSGKWHAIVTPTPAGAPCEPRQYMLLCRLACVCNGANGKRCECL